MYARLWWKEARVFWPIWVAIGLIAAGVQWFLLWSPAPDARAGFLIVLGYGWSTLYAVAVGAGVLAAERESKTQVFLDTLPVSRKMQWNSKVSFALVTTLGLTLALTTLGAMGTAELDAREYPPVVLVQGFALLLLEGLAWSLFWSIILGSSLQAAVVALLTVGAIHLLLTQNTTVHSNRGVAEMLSPILAPRLVLAGAALGFSWLVFTQFPLADQPRRAGLMLGRAGWQFERLAWETVRESRRIWIVLAGAWIGFLVMGRPRFVFAGDANLAIVFGVFVNGVAAGVSVFGAANREQSYRFLAYHGARPGVVWAARLLVWVIAITGMLVTAAAFVHLTWGWSRNAGGPFEASFVIFEAFVIGVLSGQVIRRNITASVVATLAFALLVMPQFALYMESMIPKESLILFPALVLAISRAWTGDWMNDLRGAARWLRLGGMIGAAAALLFLLYVGYRALSVPDIGSPFPPRPDSAPPTHLSPEQNAAPDYTRLIDESRGIDYGVGSVPDSSTLAQVLATGWDTMLGKVVRWLEAERGLIEPIRRASAKDEASFPRSGAWPRTPDRSIVDMNSLLLLLGFESIERRSQGDVAGAWDDLRAAFRITNQLVRSGKYREITFALSSRAQILQWALAWTADSRQSPAQLRAALAEFRTLLRTAPLSVCLEDEYTLIARTLRHDPDALMEATRGQSGAHLHFVRALYAPWWERVRALRVLRLMTARQLQMAGLEPWQRVELWRRNDVTTAGPASPSKWNWTLWDAELQGYLASTPLARPLPTNNVLLSSHDANILLSRAFEQVVALRIWQLEHDGNYPETLEALVPGLLPTLPLDPYSGQPFCYFRARGQRLLPLGLSGSPRTGTTLVDGVASQPTRNGQKLLYSVGPDMKDDAAELDYVTDPNHLNRRDPWSKKWGDLIFPLPTESGPEDETRRGSQAGSLP